MGCAGHMAQPPQHFHTEFDRLQFKAEGQDHSPRGKSTSSWAYPAYVCVLSGICVVCAEWHMQKTVAYADKRLAVLHIHQLDSRHYIRIRIKGHPTLIYGIYY